MKYLFGEEIYCISGSTTVGKFKILITFTVLVRGLLLILVFCVLSIVIFEVYLDEVFLPEKNRRRTIGSICNDVDIFWNV